MVKNKFANRKINKYRVSEKSSKKYKDEYELQYLNMDKPLEDKITLEDKLKLIKNNFDNADKKYLKYASTKSYLNSDKLFLGEVTRYKKELNKIKSELFDVFKTTWVDLIRYKYDLPSETFKRYHDRYKTYNYDVTRKGRLIKLYQSNKILIFTFLFF